MPLAVAKLTGPCAFRKLESAQLFGSLSHTHTLSLSVYLPLSPYMVYRYIYRHMYTCFHLRSHPYMQTYIYIYTYIHTHTHAHTLTRAYSCKFLSLMLASAELALLRGGAWSSPAGTPGCHAGPPRDGGISFQTLRLRLWRTAHLCGFIRATKQRERSLPQHAHMGSRRFQLTSDLKLEFTVNQSSFVFMVCGVCS